MMRSFFRAAFKLIAWITIVVGVSMLFINPLMGGVLIILSSIIFYVTRAKIHCAWCGKKSLEFLNGETGSWFWQYRNKDGSRDKRVKDNYQLASYTSLWKCKSCGAETRAHHFVDKNPSKHVDPCSINLYKKGKGERKVEDVNLGGRTIDAKSANRKNN